jgi:hypothetical protein
MSSRKRKLLLKEYQDRMTPRPAGTISTGRDPKAHDSQGDFLLRGVLRGPLKKTKDRDGNRLKFSKFVSQDEGAMALIFVSQDEGTMASI